MTGITYFLVVEKKNYFTQRPGIFFSSLKGRHNHSLFGFGDQFIVSRTQQVCIDHKENTKEECEHKFYVSTLFNNY